MFDLNQSLELNTKRMIELSDSNERTALSLSLLQVVFAGMLAFDVLDRITGDWTVVNTYWLEQISQAIKAYPGLWAVTSMLTWAIIWYLMNRRFNFLRDQSQGILTVRMRFDRKIFVPKLLEVLGTKNIAFEDIMSPGFEGDESNPREIRRLTYTEQDGRDWADSKPTIIIEYDHRNGFLLNVTVEYNKREASKSIALNSEELKKKIMNEFNSMHIWDEDGEDHKDQELAVDKRKRIDETIEQAEAEDED